jgi:hypothetical protein
MTKKIGDLLFNLVVHLKGRTLGTLVQRQWRTS